MGGGDKNIVYVFSARLDFKFLVIIKLPPRALPFQSVSFYYNIKL